MCLHEAQKYSTNNIAQLPFNHHKWPKTVKFDDFWAIAAKLVPISYVLGFVVARATRSLSSKPLFREAKRWVCVIDQHFDKIETSFNQFMK